MAERRCGTCELFMFNRTDSNVGRCVWTVPEGFPIWVRQGPRAVLIKDGKECEAWQPKTT